MKIFGSWSPPRQPWLGLLSGPKIWIGSPGQWKHLSCNGRSFSDLSHYHQQDSSHLHCHHQDPSHLHFQQVHWWRFSLQQWRRLWHWGWSVLWQNPCCPAKARWLCYLLWHRVLYTVYHTHRAARGLTLWHCDDLMAAWRRRNPWQNVTVFGPQDTLVPHTVSHNVTQCHTVLGLLDTLLTHSHPHGHKHWTATYPTCTLRLIYWLLEKPIWNMVALLPTTSHSDRAQSQLMCSYMHVKKSVWKL